MRVQPVSIAAYRRTAAPPPPAPSQSAPAGQKRDVVQFSAAAAALLQAQQQPEALSEHVAAIKQAVQSGAYQVDPQSLAVKLLPHL
jgi:flagellar biosynthesis anti-sigma factor FlgM